MSSTEAIQWVLTVVFAICAGLYLAQVRAAPAWRPRAVWSLHVLMALAMIAMAWPWGMRVPLVCYVLIFTASALYFAYLGLFTSALGHATYHSAMMGSMVLMALAMSASAMPPASGVGQTSAMPGMDMAAGPATSAGPPGWVVLSCGLAAVAFSITALVSFYLLIRGPQRPWANVLMTGGMGVAFAALVM